MVETRERETVYATDADAGPATALIVLFSLLVVAVLGFMVYFFSNSDLRNNPQTIIERNTQTTVPVPIPAPSAPTPNINITPGDNSVPAPSPTPSSTPSSTPSGQ